MNCAGAEEEVKPVMVLTVEVNTIEGPDVRRYEFTTDNCTQEQLHAFRMQLGFLLVIMGRVGL